MQSICCNKISKFGIKILTISTRSATGVRLDDCQRDVCVRKRVCCLDSVVGNEECQADRRRRSSSGSCAESTSGDSAEVLREMIHHHENRLEILVLWKRADVIEADYFPGFHRIGHAAGPLLCDVSLVLDLLADLATGDEMSDVSVESVPIISRSDFAERALLEACLLPQPFSVSSRPGKRLAHSKSRPHCDRRETRRLSKGCAWAKESVVSRFGRRKTKSAQASASKGRLARNGEAGNASVYRA
jgi:hypothetical protein